MDKSLKTLRKDNIFPDDFLWGAATSAYQIEGASSVDGKGQSIWDMFCRKVGAIPNSVNGDTTCNHYERVKEDVALMKRLGLKAYRFSIAWTRILPDGTGPVQERGLDFYRALVDELLNADIEPCATLYHWDLPLALHHKGGWMNRDIASWFSEYATHMGTALGDRVKWWVTINEPSVYVIAGYMDGNHAPGFKLSIGEGLRCMHNTLMAHGQGTQALRSSCSAPVKIGIASAGYAKIPDSEHSPDIVAARSSLFTISGRTLWDPALWLDPIYTGSYPEDSAYVFGKDWHLPPEKDLKIIHQPLDFIGVNCYSGIRVRARSESSALPLSNIRLQSGNTENDLESLPSQYVDLPYPHEHPTGQLPWLLVAPDSLYWITRFYAERYGKGRIPVVVTENGFCNSDWISLDGKVHDEARIDYTHRYLKGLKRAISEGFPVAGYFHWSLFDNFEWAEGFKPRFGLVHVDFDTGLRTPKDSALWYKNIIQSNGNEL